MSKEIGSRVGVILSADENRIAYAGIGTYVGDFPPYGAGGMFAGFSNAEIDQCGLTNPKIELDDGNVAWGCECWWVSETAYQKILDDGRERGATLVKMDMSTCREGWHGELGAQEAGR